MTRIHIKTRFLACLVLAVSIVAGMLFYFSRKPSLETFTSPLVKYKGRTARLEMLIPKGWALDSTASTFRINTVEHPIIKVSPAPSASWICTLRDRLLLRSVNSIDHLIVIVGFQYKGTSISATMEGPRLTKNAAGYSASKVDETMPGYLLLYSRSNRAAFETTYRQVCASFKVISNSGHAELPPK